MLSMIVAIALQASAEPPSAPPPAAPPAAAPAAAQAEPPMTFGVIEGRHAPKSDRVCFNDPILGSKIPTKRCISRDEFKRRQDDAKDHLMAIQRDARAPVGN